MNQKIYARLMLRTPVGPAVRFVDPEYTTSYVCCIEEDLVDYFTERMPLSVVFEGDDGERGRTLRAIVLAAFEKAHAGIDLAKTLVHPAVMRDKVEAIQRESVRERERAASSYVRRRLELEQGDAIDALVRYYEHEFRVQRAKDIEDALIAGRVDEASKDLRAIGQDALTWAGWMVDACLFPANEAA